MLGRDHHRGAETTAGRRPMTKSGPIVAACCIARITIPAVVSPPGVHARRWKPLSQRVLRQGRKISSTHPYFASGRFLAPLPVRHDAFSPSCAP
jgi:hypothetical protein